METLSFFEAWVAQSDDYRNRTEAFRWPVRDPSKGSFRPMEIVGGVPMKGQVCLTASTRRCDQLQTVLRNDMARVDDVFQKPTCFEAGTDLLEQRL